MMGCLPKSPELFQSNSTRRSVLKFHTTYILYDVKSATYRLILMEVKKTPDIQKTNAFI